MMSWEGTKVRKGEVTLELREFPKPEHDSDFWTDQILKIYFYSEHLSNKIPNTSE